MEEDVRVSPSTTGCFATEQAASLLGRLAIQVARTIQSQGAAEVHDLRVAIRRFMRVLVVGKRCFPRHESRSIRRGLKGIMVRAGSVRDRDIALRLLAKLASSASGPLLRQFRTERAEAAKTLSAALSRWVRRNLSGRWRNALDGKSAGEDFRANPVKATARRMLPRMVKEYFSRGKDAARDRRPAEELHRFRIAARKLRYTLDLFAPLYGTSLDGLLRQLKGVQAVLGEINDCAMVRRMVSRQHDPGGRKILAALKARQRKKAEQFRRHYSATYCNAAAIHRWTGALGNVGDQTRVARKPRARTASAALVRGRPASTSARTG